MLIVPVVVFPFLFLIDLQLWLRYYGLNLDPHAPLSSSVKPFVPQVLGTGKIANFTTHGSLGPWFCLAAVAAVASVVAGWIRLQCCCLAKVVRQSAPTKTTQLVCMAIPLLLTATGPADGATLDVGPECEIKTIAEAIQQAASGDTIVVDGGEHAGPLTILKTVQLVGRQGAVIAGPGTGTVVTVAAAGVRLSGFTIRGSGDLLYREDSGVLITAVDAVIEDNRFEDVLFGVYLRRASGAVVRGNQFESKPLPLPRRGDLVRVWYSDDVIIEKNQTRGGRDIVLWFSKRLTVRDNLVQGGRYGLHFMYCHDASVESNRLWENSVGAFLMYSHDLKLHHNWIEQNRGASGHGIGFKDMESVQITGNVLTGNRVGIFLENSRGRFERNLVAHNETGLSVLPSARGNLFQDNSFLENGEQVSVEGLSGTMTTNTWNANYWSDYRGYDGDGDGIGDLPYQPARLFERLADRNSALRLFGGNPSTTAIDFASQVFPIFQPRPKLVDQAPRMRPLSPPVVLHRSGDRLPWLCLAVGMLCCPAGLLLLSSWLAPSFGRRQETAERNAGKSNCEPSQPAIAVSGLTKRFRKVTAVDDLSFQVQHGEVVVLWGLNGAGKTTVIRCLLGLSAHVHGHVCHRGSKAARRLLGYVPQEVCLHADQTVLEAVSFYARLRRVDRRSALKLLADWGLKDAEHRAVGHLSGGMKQKLALVLALLSDPPVLLLDEPTSNLDAQSRYEFGKLLQQLKRDGKTLVFCSHRAAEVWRLADRVIVLEQGRKVAEGAPDPTVLGRGGEELLALARSGIAFETVPGVTSAVAAPLLAGIPVTHRGLADSFAVITAHRCGEEENFSIPPFNPRTTLIVLMGVGTVDQWRDQLHAEGYPADLPVAFVTDASTGAQQVLVTTLEWAAEDAKFHAVRPPTTVVVGAVVSLRAVTASPVPEARTAALALEQMLDGSAAANSFLQNSLDRCQQVE